MSSTQFKGFSVVQHALKLFNETIYQVSFNSIVGTNYMNSVMVELHVLPCFCEFQSTSCSGFRPLHVACIWLINVYECKQITYKLVIIIKRCVTTSTGSSLHMIILYHMKIEILISEESLYFSHYCSELLGSNYISFKCYE